MNRFLSMLLLTTPLIGQAQSTPEPYLVPEAYEVYSALLPEEWTWRVAHASIIILRNETVSYQMCLEPDPPSKQVLGTAIADYIKVNQKRWLLQRQFNIEKPYELVPREQLPKVLNTHPAGWIELSAVGFNELKTVAVVYTSHTCGGLCGGGGFHVLQKKDGKWQPLKWNGAQCSWVS